MNINLSDVILLLNKNLELYKKGEKPKNLYFLCLHDLILDEVIEKWLEDNNIDYLQNQYPRVMWETNPQGFLEESNPPVYVLDNAFIEQHTSNPFVLYFKLFNYPRELCGDEMLRDLIAKDYLNNSGFGTFDLRKRMFSIAYGFRKESANPVLDLREDLLDLFETYVLKMDLQAILNYLYDKYLRGVDNLKAKLENADNKEEMQKWIKETEVEASFIKRLIDTGFNIKDCSVYLINSIRAAFSKPDDLTFDSFIEALLEQLNTHLKFEEEGSFASTDKSKADCQAIIKWLSSL